MLKTKLLTRQNIIDMWSTQPEELKNHYCCPNCRDLLYLNDEENDFYFCYNHQCSLHETPIFLIEN